MGEMFLLDILLVICNIKKGYMVWYFLKIFSFKKVQFLNYVFYIYILNDVYFLGICCMCFERNSFCEKLLLFDKRNINCLFQWFKFFKLNKGERRNVVKEKQFWIYVVVMFKIYI